MNSSIDSQYIIKYTYDNINISKSFNLTPNEINSYVIPEKLKQHAPYDLIIIDGPCGYSNDKPGRLLPIYWSSTCLSHQNTLFYVDDTDRPLEKYCISKFMIDVNSKCVKHFVNTTRGFHTMTCKILRYK